MAVQITIDIFSGRPNPVLHIPSAAAAGLLRGAAAFRAGPVMPRIAPFPRLGYRGMVLRHDEPDLGPALPPTSRIYRGSLHPPNAAVALPSSIEEDILAPGRLGEQAGLSADLRQFIINELARTE